MAGNLTVAPSAVIATASAAAASSATKTVSPEEILLVKIIVGAPAISNVPLVSFSPIKFWSSSKVIVPPLISKVAVAIALENFTMLSSSI